MKNTFTNIKVLALVILGSLFFTLPVLAQSDISEYTIPPFTPYEVDKPKKPEPDKPKKPNPAEQKIINQIGLNPIFIRNLYKSLTNIV